MAKGYVPTITEKQRKFITEYAKDLNCTRAAKAAGYYSEVEGRRLMEKKHILDAINKELKKNEVFVGPTIPRILQELMHIAFFDPKELFDENGNPRPLSEIPEGVRRCIAGIEFAMEGRGDEAVTIKKYKIIDKHKALENLGRHLAMFTDKLKVDLPQELSSMSDEQLNSAIRQFASAAEGFLASTGSSETKH